MKTHGEIAIGSSKEFKCNVCDIKFKTKAELRIHQKQTHKENIKACIKFKKGSCQYDNENCWFLHDYENVQQNDDKEIIQKLFEMMEKMTERILKIENENGKNK